MRPAELATPATLVDLAIVVDLAAQAALPTSAAGLSSGGRRVAGRPLSRGHEPGGWWWAG